MTESQTIANAVTALKKGAVILYPTDTIWGLGCDAFNEATVDRIFSIKKRHKDKGFILLVDSVEMLIAYVSEIPAPLLQLVDVAGAPLTVVYNHVTGLPAHLLSSDGSVAIRIVQHELISKIIRNFGRPVVSTSANTSGHQPPTDMASVEMHIQQAVDLIVPSIFDTSTIDRPSRMVVVGDDGSLNWIR